MEKGIVYLIPCPIGENSPLDVLPKHTIEVIQSLDCFIVENEKTSRNFLRGAEHPKAIRELAFETLNKHTDETQIIEYIQPLSEGKCIGVISEAGCPGVADPGAQVVALAHKKGFKVIPLIGPSSILMALMGSGFSGQSFSFVGYLPKDKKDLKSRIKELESLSKKFNQTQIFIETPFRNNQMLENLKTYCSPSTQISIAANINQKNEIIKTLPISKLRVGEFNIHKIPTVFSIMA
ncbi:MAG: 16S rRNA (cytidine1402-2'-O)-methyltransferase [Flavobacteriales bacterium]|jgi:16S rRNA (cytidine1402-2'-O)-methyltransferase|tara:strand:+ start:339 stop:1046 length:708 start_codon:yes stop_codon:yes gene_type:complete